MAHDDIDILGAALTAHFESGLSWDDLEAPEGPIDPLLLTGGSEPQSPGENAQKRGNQPSEVICAFDWYQATILPNQGPKGHGTKPAEIQAEFIRAYGGTWEPCRPASPYESGAQHSSGAALWWGGVNPFPHFRSTSSKANDHSDWLRTEYPNHRVSRADIAFDFIFPEAGGLDIIHALVEPIARQAAVACDFIGDLVENNPEHDAKRKGRTHYFGSKKSEARICLYEKGLEQIAKGQVDADPNWVRLEVRIRPQKSRKTRAARLEPFDLVGFSKWISKALGAVLIEAPEPIPNPDKKEKALEHSLSAMSGQYGAKLRAFIDRQGGPQSPQAWAALNRYLYMDLYTATERAKMEKAHSQAVDEIHAAEFEATASFL